MEVGNEFSVEHVGFCILRDVQGDDDFTGEFGGLELDMKICMRDT